MDDVWTKMAREWYGDNTLVVMSDTDVYPELEADKKELVHWMRQAMVFSQDEIREALGYGTLVDESKVLVPTNYMPLSDMRSGDLETEMYVEEDIDMDTEDDEKQSDVYWLAWEGLRLSGVTVKPFGSDFLDTLKSVEVAESDPLA